MKKVTLLFVLLLSGANLMAQKVGETVYLKNGSVIRGEVIEQVPGQSLKVQTRDGSIFVYQMDEVERIAKEPTTRSGYSDKYDHGHKGLDVSLEGGVNVGKGGSASGMGYAEIGKRFNQNFYWGIGAGVIGGGDADIQIPITTTFKGLFPVTQSGIAPNIAFRTGFVYNTGDDETFGSGRYAVTVEAHHGMLFSLMPGIQIPLGQKVDFNLNLGYACSVTFGGGGAGHGFMATAGFGFHKPYDRGSKPIAPTRDRGLQMTLGVAPVYGGQSVSGGGGLILGYKLNPNISFGAGYEAAYIHAFEGDIVETRYDGNNEVIDQTTEEGWGLGGNGRMHKIFLRGQYRLNDKKFSPIGALDLGLRKYMWNDDDWFYYPWYGSEEMPRPRKTSFFVTPAVGFSLRTTNNSYFEMKVGYEITGKLQEKTYNNGRKTTTFKSRRLSGLYLNLAWTHTFSLFSK